MHPKDSVLELLNKQRQCLTSLLNLSCAVSAISSKLSLSKKGQPYKNCSFITVEKLYIPGVSHSSKWQDPIFRLLHRAVQQLKLLARVDTTAHFLRPRVDM